MSRSSIGGEQHDRRALGRQVAAAAGAADLLVVGHRRLRCPEVDHEAEGGVEPHAERAGRDQRLDPALEQVLLEGEPLGRLGLPGVRRDRVAAPCRGAQVAGDLLGRGHGEAVDDAHPGLLGEVVGQPGEALLGRAQPHHPEPQRLAVERAPQRQRVGAELLGDVVGDPLVGGGGGGQHRDPVGQVVEEGADPAVVGPEVVAPVGDAVGLVDDQQAAGRGQPGQHLVAEAGVVEPLGAHQQDVDLTGTDLVLDRLPLLDVGGVDGDRADAGPLGGGDLVAHQRQQRRHDDRRAAAPGTQQQRRDEVDRRLAPSGPLHHQRAAPVDDQGLDRGPLVVVERDVVASDERAQMRLGLLSYVARGAHRACLPAWSDSATGSGFPHHRPTPGRQYAVSAHVDCSVTARSLRATCSRPTRVTVPVAGEAALVVVPLTEIG